jgi:hypothetical protein
MIVNYDCKTFIVQATGLLTNTLAYYSTRAENNLIFFS